MIVKRTPCVLFLLVFLPALALAQSQSLAIDGRPCGAPAPDQPEAGHPVGLDAVIDVVGGTMDSAFGTGLAKGNVYRVDTHVLLTEAEFWLDYTGVQTLTFYVFESAVEFGTYLEVYRQSATVTGTGPAWYSSGALGVSLTAGMHYLVAVSWDGAMTYYFDAGDTQPTSFGAYVHGYATGTDPLPSSLQSTVNDQAIYHQRLTTESPTAQEASNWSGVKALFD